MIGHLSILVALMLKVILRTGDVAVFNADGAVGIGEIVLIYSAPSEDYAVVFPWQRCSKQRYADSVRLRSVNLPLRVPAGNLVTSVIASRWVSGGIAVILLPVHLR